MPCWRSKRCRASIPSVGVLVDVQNTLVINALMRWGTDEHQAALPAEARRRHRRRLRAVRSRLGQRRVRDDHARRPSAGDGDWSLTGRKLWITNANEADLFIVFATVDPAAGYRGITAFLVERGFAGLHRRQEGRQARHPRQQHLRADPRRLPRARRATSSARSARATRSPSRRSTKGASASARRWSGLAQGALDHAIALHARSGSSSASAIAEFQAVQHQLARAATELEAARLMVYDAARLRDAGEPFLTEAAMCKLFASEVAERVASLAVNLFGGYGFVKDYPVEKLYRDAKIGQIYEGTSNLQLQTIAKQILG